MSHPLNRLLQLYNDAKKSDRLKRQKKTQGERIQCKGMQAELIRSANRTKSVAIRLNHNRIQILAPSVLPLNDILILFEQTIPWIQQKLQQKKKPKVKMINPIQN